MTSFQSKTRSARERRAELLAKEVEEKAKAAAEAAAAEAAAKAANEAAEAEAAAEAAAEGIAQADCQSESRKVLKVEVAPDDISLMKTPGKDKFEKVSLVKEIVSKEANMATESKEGKVELLEKTTDKIKEAVQTDANVKEASLKAIESKMSTHPTQEGEVVQVGCRKTEQKELFVKPSRTENVPESEAVASAEKLRLAEEKSLQLEKEAAEAKDKLASAVLSGDMSLELIAGCHADFNKKRVAYEAARDVHSKLMKEANLAFAKKAEEVATRHKKGTDSESEKDAHETAETAAPSPTVLKGVEVSLDVSKKDTTQPEAEEGAAVSPLRSPTLSKNDTICDKDDTVMSTRTIEAVRASIFSQKKPEPSPVASPDESEELPELEKPVFQPVFGKGKQLRKGRRGTFAERRHATQAYRRQTEEGKDTDSVKKYVPEAVSSGEETIEENPVYSKPRTRFNIRERIRQSAERRNIVTSTPNDNPQHSFLSQLSLSPVSPVAQSAHSLEVRTANRDLFSASNVKAKAPVYLTRREENRDCDSGSEKAESTSNVISLTSRPSPKRVLSVIHEHVQEEELEAHPSSLQKKRKEDKVEEFLEDIPGEEDFLRPQSPLKRAAPAALQDAGEKHFTPSSPSKRKKTVTDCTVASTGLIREMEKDTMFMWRLGKGCPPSKVPLSSESGLVTEEELNKRMAQVLERAAKRCGRKAQKAFTDCRQKKPWYFSGHTAEDKHILNFGGKIESISAAHARLISTEIESRWAARKKGRDAETVADLRKFTQEIYETFPLPRDGTEDWAPPKYRLWLDQAANVSYMYDNGGQYRGVEGLHPVR